MGEIRCGKRRILSAFALHKNSAFEIHTTQSIYSIDGDADVMIAYEVVKKCLPCGMAVIENVFTAIECVE